MREWLSSLPTTNLRIAVSIVLAVLHSSAVVGAILFRGWEPTAMQFKVLAGDAACVLTMMGFDVLQFAAKRFSDSEYAAAKNPPTVAVAAPSTVEVTPKPE